MKYPTTGYVSVAVSDRSSPPAVFYKQDVLKNFAKFTRKHLSWELFCKKAAGIRLATLLKKKLRQALS